MGSYATDPILDTGVTGDLVTAGTAATALDSLAVGADAVSVLGGINTFLTHDPNIESGFGSTVERTAMGGIDGAFGLLGGPAAVVDTVTGGNGAGLFKGGANAFMSIADGILSGDTESMQNFSDSATGGNFGAAAGGVAVLGDALGQGLGMLSGADGEFDTTAMENFSEGMQNGSELSPTTHAARAGDWLGGAAWDLFNGGGAVEVTDRNSQFHGWNVVPD